MNIAIYSRKSKFTGKGESIENQIEMCTEYATTHFKDINLLVYEDEGFTGANTDRPEFKRLMQDVKTGKINVLMCYRLDRISRNVADFSSTLEILENYNVDFVSIKEQFDTSSPMGRAMTYISSVFAQLERETIAERVKDNMLNLAKTGHWLGGITPLGFKSEQVIETIDGKSKKYYKLVPEEQEIQLVRFFYDKFLELGSLIKLESYLIKNEIKTRRGKNYLLSSLKVILTNPVYCMADSTAYDYLINKNFNVYASKEEFNGKYGIIAYNRTNQAKNAVSGRRNKKEWIIAIGLHSPVIPSEKWIQVQTKMATNSDKSFRKVHSQEALLPGLLRCAKCGSYMRPKRSRLSADGTQYHYYYICELKEKSNGTKCNVKNIAGHAADQHIIKELKKLSTNNSNLLSKFSTDKLTIDEIEKDLNLSIYALQNNISENEAAISNLLETLGQAKDSIASKYIIEQINVLGEKVKMDKDKIDVLEEAKKNENIAEINVDLMHRALNNFSVLIDDASIIQKRELLKTIIEKAEWDGENLELFMFGGRCLGKY